MPGRTMRTDGSGERLERRDAAANRRLLLQAARELFADRGTDVTLHDVAARAGVGVGTAYRRFANKGELLAALFDLQVQEVSDLVDHALAAPDPWHGLVDYLEGAMELQARDRWLAQLLSGRRVGAARHDWSRDVLAPRIEAVADRAASAGHLREGVRGTDLILIQVGLNAILERTREAAPDVYRRYLQIALDGLRADADVQRGALSTAAPTLAETHAAMGPG